jgi:hypothetical protein
MLADPLPIKVPNLAATSALTILSTLSLARVDSGDGSARYTLPAAVISGTGTSSAPVIARIAHSVSNENKPVLTDRTLIRFDFPVGGPEGSVLNSFGYAVFGVPRGFLYDADGTSIITQAALGLGLAQLLIGALGVSSTAAATANDKIVRILAGES